MKLLKRFLWLPCWLLVTSLALSQEQERLFPEANGLFSGNPEGNVFDQLSESDSPNFDMRFWSNGSFTGSNKTANIQPLGFNYQGNRALSQQNWLSLAWRIADNESTRLTVQSDTILLGSDYRFTLPRGLYDKQLTENDGQPNNYGIDPVQFFTKFDLKNVMEGMSIKLGRFYALGGVESIDATKNNLASRSYAFIYNPYTHTGLLTTMNLSKRLELNLGIVTGSDIFIDSAARPTFIGSIKYTFSEETSLLFSAIVGPGKFDVDHAFHHPQVFDMVFSHQFSDELTWKMHALYGFTDDPRFGGKSNWFSVVNYLVYQLSDSIAATARLEFFNDTKGQRTGTEGLYTAFTAGLSISPYEWLVLRPEVRYDHQGKQPFQRSDLFTANFDAIVKW